MRNVTKQIEQGLSIIERTPNLALVYGELQQIFDSFKADAEKIGNNNALFNLIRDVYQMGVAVGYRKGKTDSTK